MRNHCQPFIIKINTGSNQHYHDPSSSLIHELGGFLIHFVNFIANNHQEKFKVLFHDKNRGQHQDLFKAILPFQEISFN